MRELVISGYEFSVLSDTTQRLQSLWQPDPRFFSDANGALYYRGQMDDSRRGRTYRTGEDLRAAMDALLTGKPAPVEQRPSLGCNIKWVPGNEPDYFGA